MNKKQQPQPNASYADREANRSAALRENLRKRKEQSQLRLREAQSSRDQDGARAKQSDKE